MSITWKRAWRDGKGLGGLREEGDRNQAEQFEKMNEAARQQNAAVGHKAQLDNLQRERGRLQRRNEQAEEHLASVDVELEELTAAEQDLQGRLAAACQAQAQLAAERDRLAACRDEIASALLPPTGGQNVAAWSAGSRCWRSWSRSHEGLGTGVREAPAHLECPTPAIVVGIVADLLTVRREFAPLIDLALGERAAAFPRRGQRPAEPVGRTRTPPPSASAS
ncbi:MAG: hypothetical protein U0797_14200 [Gemmataceae bacterium]